jgi:hypothetical protein
MNVLVFNCGSSCQELQIIETYISSHTGARYRCLTPGLIDRIAGMSRPHARSRAEGKRHSETHHRFTSHVFLLSLLTCPAVPDQPYSQKVRNIDWNGPSPGWEVATYMSTNGLSHDTPSCPREISFENTP